ncbi:MAG: Hsp20/alpha crystallin family protein [bacterium]
MPIKWQQFPKELEDFDKQPDAFDGRGGGGWPSFLPGFPMHRPEEPSMDIYQDKNDLYVEIPLPGIKPENVEISIEENVLSVNGNVEVEKEKKETDYIHREVRKGSFHRLVKLPIEVKGDKAEAEFVNGVLKIKVPKMAKATPKAKRIPIKIK